MKPSDQRDEMKVLAVLSGNPRFSIFDATERKAITATLLSLRACGLIEHIDPQPEYPWCEIRVTAFGRAVLAAKEDQS